MHFDAADYRVCGSLARQPGARPAGRNFGNDATEPGELCRLRIRCDDMGSIWFWSVLLGLGQGDVFSIALTLLVLRAPNAAVASSLSGMVQGIGYTGAALGPLAFGLLRDAGGDWDSTTIFFLVSAGILALIAGLAAGCGRCVTALVYQTGLRVRHRRHSRVDDASYATSFNLPWPG